MKLAKILSASAGSGKTYQLAYKYVRDVVERPELYRSILAVTFTNKATEEMKSRILGEIHTLASRGKSNYMGALKSELQLSEEAIVERALRARQLILHDYSRFTILTIDRFFQRIIRAFIRELGTDLNYNIELDTSTLLMRGADNLVESITKNDELKQWLLEFAEERITDGERWDMRSDLRALGSEIFKESSHERLKMQQSKSRLREIIDHMTEHSDSIKQEITELGKQGVACMKRCGVEYNHFKGSSNSFAKCFARYATGEFKEPTTTMLKAAEDVEQWYKKGDDANIKAAATELQPILKRICDTYRSGITHINTTELLRNNYRSFALLADLYSKVMDICDKENIMVLGETKHILSTFINDSNAPFIYEKVGNRYERFMIDEFQDTSVGEWRNMLPLLKNAMSSSEECAVFIVGDVKQSIYRWRGGDWRLLQESAKQMLGSESVEVEHLESNYRSLSRIVEFNNTIIGEVVARDNQYLNTSLDEALARGDIDNKLHSSLYGIVAAAYDKHAQKPARKSSEEGFAQATLYDNTLIDSPFIEAIKSAIERGYKYRDILILVRGATDGSKVAETLFAYKRELMAEGKAGFNILTSDVLTIEHNEITEFIIAVMRLTVNLRNDIERGVYNRFLRKPLDHTFDEEEMALLSTIAHLSPMEAFELIVERFQLNERREYIAYLQAMHEQVISFTTSRNADIQRYLNWWDERGHNEALSVEMTDDTIEIMTVHKAKGLERAVVILPYTKWDTTPRAALRPIVWAKAEASEAATVGEFPVIFGGAMQESSFSEEYYREMVMSHVDAVNLLYVALTRASEELYIYLPSRLNTKSKGSDTLSTIVPLVSSALHAMSPNPECHTTERGVERMVYRFGTPIMTPCSKHNAQSEDMLLTHYPTHQPELKIHMPSKRYADEGIKAGTDERIIGIRLHRIFERARNIEELYSAIAELEKDCLISVGEAITLRQRIEQSMQNEVVSEWFTDGWDDVKTEAEIITSGDIRRPDRVMIGGSRAVVVDYKFGHIKDKRHTKQIEEYMQLLDKMGLYGTIEGYVWYISLGEVVAVKY
ncbi:MAG: UvrD-helicase domain-containing protein [Alistipes sp.]|nr:UvrD-helicase domain-containing protein [Alistipes sp.]